MKKTGIYQIKCKINKKIYIGSAKDIKDRWRCHKKDLKKNIHHSNKLQNAWNKYGEENFEFTIIEECDENTLLEKEQFYLDTLLKVKSDYDYFKENGFNILKNAGNCLGRILSNDSKQKMSDAKSVNGKLLGQDFLSINTDNLYINDIIDKKHNNKIDTSNPFYGKKHSDDSKKIMSEKKKGINNMFYGKGPMLGKKMSDESKMKSSISHTGKNNKNSKIVFQYDLKNNLIRSWDSVGVLCKEMKLSVGNISSCCLGKRKTGYGFIWRYE